MISKELLNEVLGDIISVIHGIDKGNELLFHLESNSVLHNINIYELAHKCKEWAFHRHYELSTWKTTKEPKSEYGNSKWNEKMIEKTRWVTSLGLHYTFAETEPESIFKACQWILDNKDSSK